MADPKIVGPGYESRDISVPVVVWFAVALVVSAIIIYFAVAALFHQFRQDYPSPDSPSRIASEAPAYAPPPRLQTNPAYDLQQFRAGEEATLNSYGWVDKQAGIIRMPIQRAMDLVIQRGLPTRRPGSQNASGKTPLDMQREKAASKKP